MNDNSSDNFGYAVTESDVSFLHHTLDRFLPLDYSIEEAIFNSTERRELLSNEHLYWKLQEREIQEYVSPFLYYTIVVAQILTESDLPYYSLAEEIGFRLATITELFDDNIVEFNKADLDLKVSVVSKDTETGSSFNILVSLENYPILLGGTVQKYTNEENSRN